MRPSRSAPRWRRHPAPGRQRFSLSAAAQDGSVSRSTLYNWFGDKQSAVDAAFDYLAEQFVAMFAVAVQTEDTLAGQPGQAAVAISEHRRWPTPVVAHHRPIDLILDERGDDPMRQSVAFWRHSSAAQRSAARSRAASTPMRRPNGSCAHSSASSCCRPYTST